MVYTLVKSAHLLAVMVWMGGMFFALCCLRPAAAALDSALRVRLMHDALSRFFGVVTIAVAVILASSVWMLISQSGVARRAGIGFNMPLDWWAMTLIGTAMISIFSYMRSVLFRRLQHAVETQDWPEGGAALARIRRWVLVNLGLGLVIVVVTRIGQVA